MGMEFNSYHRRVAPALQMEGQSGCCEAHHKRLFMIIAGQSGALKHCWRHH